MRKRNFVNLCVCACRQLKKKHWSSQNYCMSSRTQCRLRGQVRASVVKPSLFTVLISDGNCEDKLVV